MTIIFLGMMVWSVIAIVFMGPEYASSLGAGGTILGGIVVAIFFFIGLMAYFWLSGSSRNTSFSRDLARLRDIDIKPTAKRQKPKRKSGNEVD